jgi:hypothetical protein
MVLALAIPLGLLLGLVLGGDPRRLADLRLRGLPLLYGAIALQIAAFPSGIFPWTTPDRVAIALWLLSYGLIGVAAWRNRRVPGVPVVAAGAASNVAAVVANGGHMPADPGAIAAAGEAYSGVNANSVAAESPALPWLIDRWAAPEWVPWANVYSVGDLLILAGATLLVAAATRPRTLARVSRRRAVA